MSALLSFTKMAFAAPRLTMALGANTMAARAYATKKLFIGNIAWGTTDDEVKEFFSQYGQLQDIYLPKDHEGRTKGFAFIEMDDVEADKAIQEANGREFNGRELRVDSANKREDRPPRGEFRPRRDNNGGNFNREFRPRRDFSNNRDGNSERSFRPRRNNNEEGGERSFRRPRKDFEDRE
ncbi:hypothetical protein BGZ75_000517 [Mortierella antarctica]|uniref:RRM domain-containing protein n=1 Tax=Mortierella alpina TaxID=64518 RepID=A0A9P8A249_MORAP|nr:hypothetical protein BGZ67_002519 [Mortierella alpina]KAF9987524.1 hypothetical protein BGZ75_000517 [Mortierella antarctica]KAG9321391.1 hypothetical protein KVV02_005764 [Mortierella alpina]